MDELTDEQTDHDGVTEASVLFHLHHNKRLCKQSRRWWFETPSRIDATVMQGLCHNKTHACNVHKSPAVNKDFR